MSSFSLFGNILFPTDFSKSSEAIIDHVAGLANAFDAKVWLLSVAPSLAEFHGVSETYFGPFSEEGLIRLEAERKALATRCLLRLQCLQKRHFGSVKTVICVKSAGVAESIVDYASETGADLIMMATRGSSAMRPFLIGSVTAKVLHDASCPVWTCPHPRELEPFRKYRRIVLALDYQWLSLDLLLRASEIAQSFGAELSVLSALPPDGRLLDPALTRERAISKELNERIEARNIRAKVHLTRGSPGEVVRQVAEEIEGADLIVTGRGHLKGPMGQLRTHVYEIICNAPCPVLTL
jgi:nucleotide-binding universal stress UspA family protein